jgi:hypothetical protein
MEEKERGKRPLLLLFITTRGSFTNVLPVVVNGLLK